MADKLVIDLELQLRGKLAQKFAAACARRKREPAELLADLIEAAIEDDLFDAVIDA